MKKKLSIALVLSMTFALSTQNVFGQAKLLKSSDEWFYSTTSTYKVDNEKVEFTNGAYPVFVGFNKYLPLRIMTETMGGTLDTKEYAKGIIKYTSYDRDVVFDINNDIITVKPRNGEEYVVKDVFFYKIKGTLYVDVRSFNITFPYDSSIEPNYIVPTEEDYAQALKDEATRQEAIANSNKPKVDLSSLSEQERWAYGDYTSTFTGDGKSIQIMDNEQDIKDAILRDINKAREDAGLSPLALNSTLSIAAQNKTDAMAKGGKYEHEGAYGDLLSQIYTAGVSKGYYRGVSENIAKLGWDYEGEEAGSNLTKLWMTSSGHKANIMRSDAIDIGIGITVSNDGTIYASTFFGRQ